MAGSRASAAGASEFEVVDQVDENGLRILAVRGELDLETVDELRRVLPERFSVTAPAVVDLSECEFIDSTGLSALVVACRRAESDGHPGLVVVAAPGSQVRKVLRITGLDGHLPLYDTRAAAVEGVSRRPLVVTDPARDAP
jgi:anti-sigma B factor antagonist